MFCRNRAGSYIHTVVRFYLPFLRSLHSFALIRIFKDKLTDKRVADFGSKNLSEEPDGGHLEDRTDMSKNCFLFLLLSGVFTAGSAQVLAERRSIPGEYKSKSKSPSSTSEILQRRKKALIERKVPVATYALSAPENLPKPEEGELTFLDVTGQQYTLKDKVVKVRAFKVSRLKEIRDGVYSVYCQLKTGDSHIYRITSNEIFIYGKEAYEFFKHLMDPLSDELYPSYGVPIYILVKPGNFCAVGNCYDQNNNEYGWSEISFKLPEPEKDKLTIQELNGSKFSLDGKIVEIEATRFSSLREIYKNEYIIFCYSDINYDYQHCTLYFSGKEAFEFFNDLTDVRSERDIYIYVSGEKFYAIGRRYSKREDEYSW